MGACVAATAFHPGATARIPELTERSRRMKCKATRRAGARGSHDDKWTVAMAKIERFFRGSCRHRRFLLTGFPALSLLALSLPPNDGFLFAFALSFSLSLSALTFFVVPEQNFYRPSCVIRRQSLYRDPLLASEILEQASVYAWLCIRGSIRRHLFRIPRRRPHLHKAATAACRSSMRAGGIRDSRLVCREKSKPPCARLLLLYADIGLSQDYCRYTIYFGREHRNSSPSRVYRVVVRTHTI